MWWVVLWAVHSLYWTYHGSVQNERWVRCVNLFCMEDVSDESRKYVCVSVLYVTLYLARDTKQIMTEGRCGPILMNSVAFGTLPGLQASVWAPFFTLFPCLHVSNAPQIIQVKYGWLGSFNVWWIALCYYRYTYSTSWTSYILESCFVLILKLCCTIPTTHLLLPFIATTRYSGILKALAYCGITNTICFIARLSHNHRIWLIYEAIVFSHMQINRQTQQE